jgi:UDP-N-acetylmuramoylalanine--D-glutamate ligase
MSETRIINDWKITGKKISVLGAARSGIAVAALLKRRGAEVFVSDINPEEKLQSQTAELSSLGIRYETGGHTDRLLNADIIVVSPGVPSDTAIIKSANAKGITIVSELEVASWFSSSKIIAVTGTNGKTTTTTLIGQMLEDDRKKHVVAGNIGTAFSSCIDTMDSETIAVLEVSSFQLDYIERFHPSVSVMLNITPDHLDRYDHNFEKYIAAKCRIFENQTNSDVLVYNYDDAETNEQIRRFASLHVRTLPFGIERRFDDGAFIEDGKMITMLDGVRYEIVDTDQIAIPGIHNLYNAMASTLAAHVVGVNPHSIGQTLHMFKGVEHRLEFVREFRGIEFINDSKATNIDSVWYALQAFAKPLIVLLGGRDKGNDYSKLDELVRQHVRAIVAIGESADKVIEAFGSMKKVVRASSMDEAIQHAIGLATAGDIVLLSPACASFDWFQNYEHRGRVFKQIVNGLQ